MNVIFITSKQALAQSLMKYEEKTMTCLMMWHLDYNALRALLEQFESTAPRDVTYQPIGGCPREVISIIRTHSTDLQFWISDKIDMVRRTLMRYIREAECTRSELLPELREHLEDVYKLEETRLFTYLLQDSIIMPLAREHKRISNITEEAYIGRHVAFQLPVYYYIMLAMTCKSSPDITVQGVLEVAGTTAIGYQL